MAEPLGITASIIGILGLAGTVVRYLASVKDAPEARNRILIEVSSVHGILFMLHDLSRREELGNDWHGAAGAVVVANGPLEQFKSELENIAARLRPGHAGRVEKTAMALTWPFSKRELTDIIQRMERLKTLITMGLQGHQIQLSQANQKDVAMVLQNQADQISRMEIKERRKIVDWLSPLNFWIRQNDIFSRRQEGTGKWLLDSDAFKRWLDGDSRILHWIGAPGAGKTVLASIVINHLERIMDDRSGLTGIYCNFETENQTTVNLIASLLQQLIQRQQAALSQDVVDLHSRCIEKSRRPSLADVSRLLNLEVQKFAKVFIVVDALDECSGEERNSFLAELQNLLESRNLLPHIHLLITSRNSIVSDVERTFTNITRLDVRAKDEDVRLYTEARIEMDHELASFIEKDQAYPPLRAVILDSVASKANGMYVFCDSSKLLEGSKIMADIMNTRFLLAQMHVNALARQISCRYLRETLHNLPEELDREYEEVMRRIKDQNGIMVQLAHQVLSWITCAFEPLTVKEIQCALAVRPHDTDLDEEGIPLESILVAGCAGIVTIDNESGIIRLVHYTAHDYLKRNHSKYFPGAQTDITRTCLTLLSFKVLKDGHYKKNGRPVVEFARLPLFKYAARHWGEHAHEVDPEERQVTQELALDFLEQISDIYSLARVMEIKTAYAATDSPEHLSGLHVTAHFGLEEIAGSLIERGAKVDAIDSSGRTALHYACLNGQATTVRLLLEKGANIEAEDDDGFRPLYCAVQKQNSGILRLLIDKGADPNAMAGLEDRETAFHRAVLMGNEKICRELLDGGADSQIENAAGETSLHIAAEEGHGGIIQMLLKTGLYVDIEGSQGETALHKAARAGNETCVQLLLDNGAKADSRDGCQVTPLHEASSASAAVVLLLLNRGANLNWKDDYGRRPLHFAAEDGQEVVVQMFIKRGAEVNVEDNEGETPLHLAAASSGTLWYRHVEETSVHKFGAVMQYLIDSGADVEAKNNAGMTPLHSAAASGSEKAARLLIMNGADVQAKDAQERTPLHLVAAFGENKDIQWLAPSDPRSLLRSGQGVDAEYEALAQYFIEKGADIQATDNFGQTSLQWAAACGSKRMVQLLLDRGADVKAVSMGGKTALGMATVSGRDAEWKVEALHEKEPALDNHGKLPLRPVVTHSKIS